jgi:hypothetical protein
VIFAPHDLPCPSDFIDHWRELAHKAGLPGIYFVAMTLRFQTGMDRYRNPIVAPFDAVTPLTPQDFLQDISQSLAAKILRRLSTRNFEPFFSNLAEKRLRRPARYKYAQVVAQALHDLPDDSRFLPSVSPGWDNTPRSGSRGVVFEGSTPELFAQYLSKAVALSMNRPPQQRIIFLKAWNEWAEGNYVEPDCLGGRTYLDAIRKVILPSTSPTAAASRIRPAPTASS